MSQKHSPAKVGIRISAGLDLETEIRHKILSVDDRYGLGAYVFVYEALDHTQRMLGRDPASPRIEDRHVSGQELLEGMRHLAIEQFGAMALGVLNTWGVHRTEDFGELVFGLVEHGLMGKTDSDSREDFAGGYDFGQAFGGPIELA